MLIAPPYAVLGLETLAICYGTSYNTSSTFSTVAGSPPDDSYKSKGETVGAVLPFFMPKIQALREIKKNCDLLLNIMAQKVAIVKRYTLDCSCNALQRLFS